MWRPYASGATIGGRGSEDGIIIRDEEHELGARITLERECRQIPFAVTCGVYGWFVHTRYAGSEDEAEFEEMAAALVSILDLVPSQHDAEEPKIRAVTRAIERFVARFA
jgi:hypothetical protein